MPELPEVETVRRHLELVLPGRLIVQMTFKRADLRYPMPVQALLGQVGARIGEVRRRAKYLLLQLEGAQVLVHLGMSGRLFAQPGPEPEWQKHEHWRWQLDGAVGDPLWLRYVDARRFGALDLLPPGEAHPLLCDLGPEPLSSEFSAGYLHSRCVGRQVPIKQLLMDGAVVVGIGNIYASETCFRARISPLRPAERVTLAECAELVQQAQAVLRDAIDAGGSTLRDFVGGNQAPGYFQQQLDVYQRHGQECNRCRELRLDAPVPQIVAARVGQRATFWCPRCQT